MARARRGFKAHRRRKAVLDAAKGYYGARSRQYRTACISVRKALKYEYRDRRNKKRDFRRLWITRISAAARLNGVRYSTLMHWLDSAGIAVDRKVLSEIAIFDPAGFTRIVEQAKKAA